MKRRTSLLLLSLLSLGALVCLVTEVQATTLVNLATGYNQTTNSLIGYGSLDDDWQLVSAPAGIIIGPAKVLDKNSSWFDSEPNARWISSQSAPDAGIDLAVGSYEYQLTFSLTKYTDLIYKIEAFFGSDNYVEVAGIKLNDNPLMDTDGCGSSGGSCPQSIFSDNQDFFNNGSNALSVAVYNGNAAGYGGPTGFVMWGTVSSEPISEPATILLFGSGLAGLGFVRRRRQIS